MPNARAALHFRYIGANLHRARVRAGLTQEQLAEKAELDLRFLQRVERGQTNLSVSVLVALADALAIKPGRLLARAEMPPAQRGRPPRRPPPKA